MKYTKPTLTIIGDAVVAVKSVNPKPDASTDSSGSLRTPINAYDLDE